MPMFDRLSITCASYNILCLLYSNDEDSIHRLLQLKSLIMKLIESSGMAIAWRITKPSSRSCSLWEMPGGVHIDRSSFQSMPAFFLRRLHDTVAVMATQIQRSIRDSLKLIGARSPSQLLYLTEQISYQGTPSAISAKTQSLAIFCFHTSFSSVWREI